MTDLERAREIVSSAANLEEWLKELEEYEHLKPEDAHYVKVSARLMCKILRMAKGLREAEGKE